MEDNRLKLNTKLFKKEIIEEAINDYTNIANIDISFEYDYFICVFSNCKYNLSITMKEFTNYLIYKDVRIKC